MKLICIGFFLMMVSYSIGQNYINFPGVPVNTVIAPEYPGGDAGLFIDLQKHVRYPSTAVNDEIQGTVQVEFIIPENGKIRNVVVKQGVRPDIDKAAVRAVKKLKKWKPATQYGTPVTISFGIPVRFRLLSAGEDFNQEPRNNDVFN